MGMLRVEGGRGSPAVSGGVEEEKKATNKTRLSSCLVSRRTVWASHSLGPPLLFLSPIPPSSEVETAHIPLDRGGARLGGLPQWRVSWGDGRWCWEWRMNPRSTTDAIDLGFKLRSHVQSPLSIMMYGTPIRKVKFS